MIRKIMFLFAYIAIAANAGAQNRYEEYINCDVANRHIVIIATVKGAPYKFILDVTQKSSFVNKEYADKIGLQKDSITGLPTLEKIGIGQNLFLPKLTVQIIEDNDLKKLDIAGILGANVFKRSVLTINKNAKTIALSDPYKPVYMSLRNRADMISGDQQSVTIDGKKITASLDSLLDAGVLTLDFTKARTYFETNETIAKIETPKPIEKEVVTEGLITHLDRKTFLKDVFDFRQNSKWQYQGDIPCVIDFWATWCIPCRKLAPIMEELARQYKGRVKFYKVDVDEEKEIADGYFGIVALPTLLFVPMKGEPQKELLTAREQIVEKIEEMLKKK